LFKLGLGGPGAEVMSAGRLPRAPICAAEGRHMLSHEASWCSDGPVSNQGAREIALTIDIPLTTQIPLTREIPLNYPP